MSPHQTLPSLTHRGWTPINLPPNSTGIGLLMRAAEANGDVIPSLTSTSGQQPGPASRLDQVSSSPSSPRLLPRPPPVRPPVRPSPSSSLPPRPTPSLTPAPAPARTPSPSSRYKKKLCDFCDRLFSYKSIADHRKVHQLEGEEGARAWPCKQCKKHPKGCRVATNPIRLGTYSCSCCLRSHKKCEYTGLKKSDKDVADRHPKIWVKSVRPWEL